MGGQEALNKSADKYEANDSKYLRYATLNWPEDVFCGWCGKLNDFADDCGFFYISGNPDNKEDNRVTCESCYRGKPGAVHIDRYGVGER